MTRVERLPAARMPDVVSVLADAFRTYPVMRYVAGEDHPDVDRRIDLLVGFFVLRRVRLNGPLLGLWRGDELVGAATMTHPVEPAPPPDLLARRDELWEELGVDARERYDAHVAAAKAFITTVPHHHLNMIGIRPAHAGQGLARPLLEAVADLALADPASQGVSLTTETEANVRLYEHFGYEVTGHARISPTLETWGMFLRLRTP